MSDAIKPAGGGSALGTTKLGQTGAHKKTGALEPAPTGKPVLDSAHIKASGEKATEGPTLAELVAKAREASGAAKAAPAEPSLAIQGVPTGKPLPVTVKAAITVTGTAKVNKMSDEGCEIRLSVKGKALFMTIERDITVSLEKRKDGSYLYRYKDEKSGEVSEGVAQEITLEGNTRKLTVKDTKTGEATPVSITDMGGGRFKIAGDGFEADINKI